MASTSQLSAIPGYTISSLPPVAVVSTELPDGLIEVELPIGQGGAYVNKKLTIEQLLAYLAAQQSGAGAGILFISDTDAFISPEDLDDLNAGELFWLYDDAPPTPVQRTTVQLTQVKNDGVITNKQASGGTDNAPALMAVQEQYATSPFREQPAVELVMPAGGIVTYAAGQEGNNAPNTNKWFLHYRDAKLNLNGATLIPTYSGSDNFFSASIYRRELLQSNPDTYGGTKEYFLLPRIATVQAGSTTITVLDPADIADETIYFVGARITVQSKETVLGEEAYPPNTKHNEKPLVITAINRTTGVIQLDRALEYEHRADWPENPQTSGGGAGGGRIVPLDAPGCEYMENAEFVGPGTLQASNEASPGAFGFIANNVSVTDVRITNGGTITESLTKTTVTGGVFEGEVEFDKGDGDTELIGTEIQGFASNGGGMRSLTWTGGKSGSSIQVASPLVSIVGVECRANVYTTDKGTKTKGEDVAVGSYTGFHNTSLFHIKQLGLGAYNGTTAYLSPAEWRTVTVTSVDGQRAGFYWPGTKGAEANFIWRGAQPGTRFYTLTGSKIGRQVGQVQFAADVPARTSGTFYVTIEGFTPQVGDVYEFSNVLTVKDDGGHTILTPNHPAKLYNEETLVWKGNQTVGYPGPVTITKADLRFRDGGNNAYFYLRGKPVRLDFTSITTANGQLEITGTDQAQSQPSYQHLASFNLATAGTRFASGSGASTGLTSVDGKPGPNQYRPAGFGVFAYTLALHFEGLTLAQIPDDWTLTITSNFS